MVRRIVLEWPSEDIGVIVRLLGDVEPELCDLLWGSLVEPVRMFCRHPVSTGEEFSAAARPPRHPVETGVVLGRNKRLFCDVPVGSVNYSVHGGYGGLSCYYGPCTEPVTVSGAVVGRVEEEDLPDLRRAGLAVWKAYYELHTPFLMMVGRCLD